MDAIQKSFGFLDLFVFVTICFATFAIVWWSAKYQKKSSEPENNKQSLVEYILMGRRLTLPLFVGSLVASYYGGILGVTEMAYQYGVYTFVSQGIFWYLTYLIFAFFIVDRVKKNSAQTLPELVGQLFGRKSSYVAAVFNILNVVPITYVLSASIVLEYFLGWPLPLGAAVSTTAVILYMIGGGFRAVIFSDLIQFVVMCSSVVMVAIFAMTEFGGPSVLWDKLPEKYLSVTGGYSYMELFAWGMIALSTLVDPNFYQRCFAADSTKTAKKGIFFATMIWVCFDLCMLTGCMYAAAFYPGMEPKTAYLNFAIEILPPGFKGFFIAGIIATIISTMDSYLFLASNTISYDMLPHPEKYTKIKHTLSIIFIGFLAVMFSQMFDGSIKRVWKTLGSYSAGCMLTPVVFALFFPKRISDHAFVSMTLISAVAITVWRNVDLLGEFLVKFSPNIDHFMQKLVFLESNYIDELYIGIAIELVFCVVCLIKYNQVQEKQKLNH